MLAQLRCELVQVLLRVLLAVEKWFEEICLRGRQGFRPHGHGLGVFLECFGLFEKRNSDGPANNPNASSMRDNTNLNEK